MMTDQEFDEWIQTNFLFLRDWDEPLRVFEAGKADGHYACPLCIARFGLRASSISGLPTDPEEVRAHIRDKHVILDKDKKVPA